MTDSKTPNIRRRNFLKSAGVVGLLGLAGCSTPDFSFGNTAAEKFILEKIPPEDILKNRKTVLIQERSIQGLGIRKGEQIRLHVKGGVHGEIKPAVYTIREDAPFTPEGGKAYMSEENMKRIDAIPKDYLVPTAYGPHESISSLQVARDNNEYIERYLPGKDTYINYAIIAPHGGQVEKHTAEQAIYVRNQIRTGFWASYGFGETDAAATERWFIPSAEMSENSYPGLEKLRANFRVELHGKHDLDVSGIHIGGLASLESKNILRDNIRAALQKSGGGSIDVNTYQSSSHKGTNPHRIANRSADQTGIVIFQEPSVKEEYWREIAEGITNGIVDIHKKLTL